MADKTMVPLGTTHVPGRQPFEDAQGDLGYAANVTYGDAPDIKSGLSRPDSKTVGGKNA